MLHVNGKWRAQNLTGTQRYADEMARAIVTTRRTPVTLHLPKGASAPEWASHGDVRVEHAPVSGVLFEQLYLPLRTMGKLLVNFAGPAPLLKRRQLVTMHDATPFRYPTTFRRAFVVFYFCMYFVLVRTARHLSTVSQFSAGELHEIFGIPTARFVVAGCSPHGLADVGSRRPEAAVDGDFYLVVGTLAVHKNLREPLAAVATSGRRVVVVGVAGHQQVFSAAGPLGAEAIVPGRVDDAELVWLYQNATALIFPSKYEGFGLPPTEAQALGCPVVTSNAASLPEVCGDGALYFDPDDTESLLGVLARLEDDPQLRDTLVSTGLENARRFSWDRSAQSVLDAVLAERGRRWRRGRRTASAAVGD